jgi:PAT family beta-lactamase induction signal transducer AmpG
MNADPANQPSPWRFVPLLYFLQGMPYIVVNGMTPLLLKSLATSRGMEAELDNAFIGFWTTIIGVPWTAKMLWGPLVDLTLTKRRWIVITQILLLVTMIGFALAVQVPTFVTVTLAVLFVAAFLSSTHDVAADGFYLLACDSKQQAYFVGIRSTFYRLATIFGSGFLVIIAGQLERIGREPFWINEKGERILLNGFEQTLQRLDMGLESTFRDDTARAWTIAILIGAAFYGVGLLVNALAMPKPPADRPRTKEAAQRLSYREAFGTFFRQRRIWAILAFILFYRFGEALIGKMSPLFLKDPISKGGLELRTEDIGIITGTWGVVALAMGGILGGFLISRYGIKKCFWPMVLALNVPNLFYIWAAMTHPGMGPVTALICVDQFGYGFGFSAYMVYLMFVSQGSEYETSNYAIATGLMALGMLVAQAVSGFLQVQLGYLQFFIAVVILGIPGILTLFFIPMDKADLKGAPIEID